MLKKVNFWEKAGPVMMIVLVVMAFGLGAMWSKINYLEKGLPADAVAGSNAAPTGAAQPVQPTPVPVTMNQIKALFGQNVVKFGDANSKVVFVEFADPSCPYCHVASGKNPELNKQVGQQFLLVADGGSYVAPEVEMRKLVEQGKAAMAWVYTMGHGNGEMATKALYCAFDAGKFWQVHDLLMNNKGYDLVNNTFKNDKTKSGELAQYLKTAMDSTVLKSCLDSGKYDTRIQSEVALSRTFGVNGTPGFFVNTKNFGGAYSWTDMKADAEAALK
jgi:protein-disulfide isomerase